MFISLTLVGISYSLSSSSDQSPSRRIAIIQVNTYQQEGKKSYYHICFHSVHTIPQRKKYVTKLIWDNCSVFFYFSLLLSGCIQKYSLNVH